MDAEYDADGVVHEADFGEYLGIAIVPAVVVYDGCEPSCIIGQAVCDYAHVSQVGCKVGGCSGGATVTYDKDLYLPNSLCAIIEFTSQGWLRVGL